MIEVQYMQLITLFLQQRKLIVAIVEFFINLINSSTIRAALSENGDVCKNFCEALPFQISSSCHIPINDDNLADFFCYSSTRNLDW